VPRQVNVQFAVERNDQQRQITHTALRIVSRDQPQDIRSGGVVVGKVRCTRQEDIQRSQRVPAFWRQDLARFVRLLEEPRTGQHEQCLRAPPQVIHQMRQRSAQASRQSQESKFLGHQAGFGVQK
jgi:hypothetical protein